MAWLRDRLTPRVLKDIAEADCGSYDKNLAKILRDSVDAGRPMVTADYLDTEGLELCSNHWYEQVDVMIVSGALLIAFYGELGQEECGNVFGHAGRIARVTTATLDLGAADRLAYAELLAWSATRKPYIDDEETPQSMLWYSHLCVLATVVVDVKQRERTRIGSPWLTSEFVESHASQIDNLIDREMSALTEDSARLERPTRLRRLVSLEDTYGSQSEWWRLTRETLARIKDDLPKTRAVLEKVQADRPT